MKLKNIMEDRFKFKFFDKVTKFMGDIQSLSIQDDWAMVKFSYADEETPDDEIKLSTGVLIQCTGLKDKNDKLIYEGDVVQCSLTERLIEFKDGGSGWNTITHDGFKKINQELTDKIEITGNIYENLNNNE